MQQPDTFPHPSLTETSHRPWPRPEGRWRMRQEWRDLLFWHVEADAEELRSRIPEGLELDTFDGKAWLGLVPFDMRGVTLRGCPAPPALCDFPELNIRTYVIRDGKPGVWFFSLDVPNPLAVWGARSFFHLPYFRADMRVRREDGWIHYQHRRPDRALEMRYRALESVDAAPGSFARWATERYCLYCRSRRGDLFRGNIHHAPWPLHRSAVEFRRQEMFGPFRTGAPHPDVLFSPSLHVVVYPLERLKGNGGGNRGFA